MNSDIKKDGAPAGYISPVRTSIPDAGGLRWEDVPLMEYKESGSHFKLISRQVLFGEGIGLADEVRYFEIGPGGHSTYERHEHVHAVVIVYGSGRAIVGDRMQSIAPYDLVHIPAMTWHQFQAESDSPLGFLCVSSCERDRPQQPSEAEAALIRSTPLGEYVRL